MGICIISGYAAIAHFMVYPVFGIMYYVLFCDGTLVYTLIYEKTFKIPALFERAINIELAKLGPGSSREKTTLLQIAQSKVLGRQLRSIPAVGIKGLVLYPITCSKFYCSSLCL